MALRLTIRKGDVADSGNRSRWTFGVNGGRIGRARDNDWVLVDPERFISAHHAEIEHRAGEWWLSDTSTNGTFINDASQPLGRGGRHRLSNGDRVRMGSLEVVAEISGGNDFLPDSEDVDLSETALDDSFEVRSLLSNEPEAGRPRPADAYGQALPLPGEPARLRVSPLPPAAATPAGPAAQASRPQGGEADLWPGVLAFCQGAGIDPHSLPPEKRMSVLREAGLALRETVLGLMELSKSRAEFTREAGISGSRRTQDATSPLMQVTVLEDALRQMLTGTVPGGNRAVDEIRAQFAKTRHHQQSMLVAMREALTALLAQLDPDELEQQFGGATRGPGNPEAMARYWSLYRELFRAMAASDDASLPPAFQEEFARAYQTLAAVGLRPIGKSEGSS
jgi:type VI secretion system protein